MSLTDEVYREAVNTLERCCTPMGLQASGNAIGHHQIWARDAVIAALGARLVPNETIQAALRSSIQSLCRHRTPAGEIPNNVDCATQRPNFRAYADSGLWWIVGSALLARDEEGIAAVLRWYDGQDVDRSGLLSIQEGSDWQDLFCTRGKGLYVNCLYVLALQCAGQFRRAEEVSRNINTWFWYRGDHNLLRHVSHTFSTEGKPLVDSLGRVRWIPEKRRLVDEQYYLPYLGFRAVGEWFDSLGNLLAILAGVADEQQTNIILDFINCHKLHTWPLRSLTPVVRPGDPDWRDYYGLLNLPYCYHNGGVWPFIGGFYVAALVKARRFEAAEIALHDLAKLNQSGHFNEWHHGETGKPMGVVDQAWSAGMYIYAAESVRLKRAQIAPDPLTPEAAPASD